MATAVARWAFSSNANDSEGSLNGSLQGDAAFTSGGPGSRGYMTLDGTGDYVTVGTNSLRFEGFSWAAWLRSSSNGRYAFDWVDDSHYARIVVYGDSTKLRAMCSDITGATLGTKQASTVLSGSWQHWVYVIPAPSVTASGTLFDGTSAMARPTTASLQGLGDAGTFMCRFNYSDVENSHVLLRAGTGYSPCILVHGDIDRVRAYINSAGSGGTYVNSTQALSAGTWYDCIVTWLNSGGTTTVYVYVKPSGGSEQADSGTTTSTEDTWDYDLYVGGQASGVNKAADGSYIKDCVLLSTVATSGERTNYYAGTLPTSNLVGKWALTSDWDDASGNGNNLLGYGPGQWYLNGAADGTGSWVKSPPCAPRTLCSLAATYAGTSSWYGGVQEMRLFSGALTATEIENLYLYNALQSKIEMSLTADLGVDASTAALITAEVIASIAADANLSAYFNMLLTADLGVDAVLTATEVIVRSVVATMAVDASLQSYVFDVTSGANATARLDRASVEAILDRLATSIGVDREGMTETLDRRND